MHTSVTRIHVLILWENTQTFFRIAQCWNSLAKCPHYQTEIILMRHTPCQTMLQFQYLLKFPSFWRLDKFRYRNTKRIICSTCKFFTFLQNERVPKKSSHDFHFNTSIFCWIGSQQPAISTTKQNLVILLMMTKGKVCMPFQLKGIFALSKSKIKSQNTVCKLKYFLVRICLRNFKNGIALGYRTQ